ncbi:DUF2285 domain-containing protein [Shinella sp. NM-101]|uniref:DUF2285 domain-containing protein n=1 Tax=Shinella sp. NM-101 TaxID=2744455 RepID=UPI001F256E50|nr:DUF2285 domain-containing protein [Shinella sp. NM-101]
MSEDFLDNVPEGETITEYDRSHMKLYMRLFDSSANGADWREAVELSFEIDPSLQTERARRVYDNHLARARWMVSIGYRLLVDGQPSPA